MPLKASQSSLFDEPMPGANTPEFSVSEISRLIKKTVEDTFSSVRIRGEISECKFHSNGHVYITLKDETAVLAAVCWRGQVSKLGIKPEVGMEVVCTGRITTYGGQSKYQLVIEGMSLAGIGALLKLLDERKRKLSAEGLFDPARKQLLPFLPDVIGVVTSPSGAVIRDILHRLDDRFPRHVLVWPVAVQGEGAAEQIAAAIEGFNKLPPGGPVPRPDVLIVARGGGSVEDLMPFNEENVVRAVAASHIPIISAVGHETDTTLIDFASDLRAPTPSAAAELVVPKRDDLLLGVLEQGRRMVEFIRRMLDDRRQSLDSLHRALGDPVRTLEPLAQRLDEKTERLSLAWMGYLERQFSRLTEASAKMSHPRNVFALSLQRFTSSSKQLELAIFAYVDRLQRRLLEIGQSLRHPGEGVALAEQKLEHLYWAMQSAWRELFSYKVHQLDALGPALTHLSPKNVLGRGYVLVHDADGSLITRRAQTKAGDTISIEFEDG